MNFSILKGILIPVVTTFMGIVGTHLFYKSKLEKERKAGAKKILGEKIMNSFLKTRNFERQLRKFESVFFEGEKTVVDLNRVYPSIFYSLDNLNNFMNSLEDIIASEEAFLDMKSVAFLLAMQDYLTIFYTSSSAEVTRERFNEIGVNLYPDIVKWQKDFDLHLVKKINKYDAKLYSLKGRKWEKLLENIRYKYVEDSILTAMTENESLLNK